MRCAMAMVLVFFYVCRQEGNRDASSFLVSTGSDRITYIQEMDMDTSAALAVQRKGKEAQTVRGEGEATLTPPAPCQPDV